MTHLLRRVSPAELNGYERVTEDAAHATAVGIVEDIRGGGEPALRAHAERSGDIEPGRPMVVDRGDLKSAFEALDPDTRALLTRVHRRIERFSRAQRNGLSDLTIQVEGGQAGHRWLPVTTVGACAPGGSHPLPSTVLMTVTPARVAGVTSVWMASPRPSSLTLAASWVAGADGLLTVGGAQAVAALAFGTVGPAAELIVGPGDRLVTAAKRHLLGEVGIDGLTGPGEVLVIADESADPGLVAADLLAQAEHDSDGVPGLIVTTTAMADAVEQELAARLTDLPNVEVARSALVNGFCVVVPDLRMAAEVSDDIAPEQLALHVNDPRALALQVRNYGSLFVGANATGAFTDYGAGPNHVLPTAGGSRFRAGLSVMTFLKPSTWLSVDRPHELIDDTVQMARLEGLEAHARAAMARNRNL